MCSDWNGAVPVLGLNSYGTTIRAFSWCLQCTDLDQIRVLRGAKQVFRTEHLRAEVAPGRCEGAEELVRTDQHLVAVAAVAKDAAPAIGLRERRLTVPHPDDRPAEASLQWLAVVVVAGVPTVPVLSVVVSDAMRE